jgi:hypothetical protein
VPQDPTATRQATSSCEANFNAVKKRIAESNDRVQRAARKERAAKEKEQLAVRRRRDLW